MVEMKKLIILVILLAFAISAYFYPSMPEQMASHWNAAGDVNGYLPRFWGVFLLPIMMAVFGVVLYLLPFIDPLKKNYRSFRKEYDGLILVLVLFLLFVHVQAVLWNAGVEISFSVTMPVGVGMLMVYLGHIMKKVKRNWFIGIRTPWTMSSDRVWEKTHMLGSKLFIASGIIIILSSLVPAYSIYLILATVFGSVILTVVYSFLEFRKNL